MYKENSLKVMLFFPISFPMFFV